MPSDKKHQQSKPDISKAVATQNTPNILGEFDSFVSLCRNAVNDKLKELKASGRDDYSTNKTIIDKVLISMFRGSKWSP